MTNKEKHYNEFISYVVRWGRLTNLLGLVFSFGPALILLTVFGLKPPTSAIIAGAVSILSVSGAFWIVEPISYYPVLGIPGTYMSFLAGNISNLRLPCAAVSQKAAGVEPGTEEGAIIATLGIAASIIVNTTILTFGAIIGASIFNVLPEVVKMGLQTYLIPAIFGAVFVQFARTNLRLGAIALALAFPLTFLLNKGFFAFLPGSPSYAVIILTVFGTIYIGRMLYEREAQKKT